MSCNDSNHHFFSQTASSAAGSLRMLWRLSVAAVLTICLGCIPGQADHEPVSLVQIEGLVTLAGRPLQRTSVLLVPAGAGSRARGVTGSGGEFRLLHESEKAGVEPGDYRVVFQPLSLPTGQPATALDAAYQSPESTPVQITISESTKVLNFQLTNHAIDFESEQ